MDTNIICSDPTKAHTIHILKSQRNIIFFKHPKTVVNLYYLTRKMNGNNIVFSRQPSNFCSAACLLSVSLRLFNALYILQFTFKSGRRDSSKNY